MSFPKDSRKKANARDAARHTWLKKGDGDNRASLQKALAAIVDSKKRAERREQMTHRKDLATLRQHPLAGAQDEAERAIVRNLQKTKRKARR